MDVWALSVDNKECIDDFFQSQRNSGRGVSHGTLAHKKEAPSGLAEPVNREVWMTQGFLPFPPRLFGGTHTA